MNFVYCRVRRFHLYPGDLSFASGCALSVGGSLIFGSSAICRYLSYSVSSTTDSAAVEEWVEWEATALVRAEKAITEAKSTGNVVTPEALAPLKYLENKLIHAWLVGGVRKLLFLCGCSPTNI